jgi:hypothetical protein
MRNMSFALTTQQVRDRIKTVTRRTGWEFLKPGEMLRAVEKCQGLKKGEKVTPIATIRVVSVRHEPLNLLRRDRSYGREEMRREGFSDLHFLTPEQFVDMFCASHRVKEMRPDFSLVTRPCTEHDTVTRIEFEYV